MPATGARTGQPSCSTTSLAGRRIGSSRIELPSTLISNSESGFKVDAITHLVRDDQSARTINRYQHVAHFTLRARGHTPGARGHSSERSYFTLAFITSVYFQGIIPVAAALAEQVRVFGATASIQQDRRRRRLHEVAVRASLTLHAPRNWRVWSPNRRSAAFRSAPESTAAPTSVKRASSRALEAFCRRCVIRVERPATAPRSRSM